MVDKRKIQVERIHERIASHAYEVDAEAVAEAILDRLLAGGARPARED